MSVSLAAVSPSPFAGKRVLIFGDSLSHHGRDDAPPVYELTAGSKPTLSVPGDVLAHALFAGGSPVRIDARVGRSAWNFYRREAWQDLLAADLAWRPDVVIIKLGTNDLGLGDKATLEKMTALRDTFYPGSHVIAVGPPSFASANRQVDSAPVVRIMEAVFGDNFIDARPLTADLTSTGRAGDGVHFVASGAKLYAARLEAALGKLVQPGSSGGSEAKSNLIPVAIGFGAVLAVGAVFVGVTAARRRSSLANPPSSSDENDVV